MALAGCEFLEAKSWLPAFFIVMECHPARNDIDSSEEIMVLTRSCPVNPCSCCVVGAGLREFDLWILPYLSFQEELKIDTAIKYVIYQDDRSETWQLQAVAVSPDNFECRKPLPLPGRGLEGNKLSEVAGIPVCTFVHTNGFIGANKSYGGALAMARASLKA